MGEGRVVAEVPHRLAEVDADPWIGLHMQREGRHDLSQQQEVIT